jgi:NADPH:quinone reductase-like Zn-dependent oxidoreductase
MVEAGALPLVTTTGKQLISLGTRIRFGQTVLVTGAVGSVGRSAVFTAKERGAQVIAGVLKKQIHEAASVGADQVVATDDDDAMMGLPQLDAVADTVGGNVATTLLAKVKRGGVFASVVGSPQKAKQFSTIEAVPVRAIPDPKILLFMGRAVEAGRLKIPIGLTLPLREAAKGHAAVAKGGVGKVLLVVEDSSD